MDRLFEEMARALASPMSRRQTFSHLWKVAAGVAAAGAFASPALAQRGAPQKDSDTSKVNSCANPSNNAQHTTDNPCYHVIPNNYASAPTTTPVGTCCSNGTNAAYCTSHLGWVCCPAGTGHQVPGAPSGDTECPPLTVPGDCSPCIVGGCRASCP